MYYSGKFEENVDLSCIYLAVQQPGYQQGVQPGYQPGVQPGLQPSYQPGLQPRLSTITQVTTTHQPTAPAYLQNVSVMPSNPPPYSG